MQGGQIALVLDERTVATMWERQAFDARHIRSLGFSVVSRGIPSDAGGPDYQEVVLSRQDGFLVRGDVELHFRASDWYRHGHHLNPAYNNVVLHVVWKADGGLTFRHDGEIVPVLEVGGRSDVADTLYQPAVLSHPCIGRFAALDGAELRSRIVQAGLDRFDSLVARFQLQIEDGDPLETLYCALLEAMGYASNRGAFRALAEAVPFAWLASVPAENRSEILLAAAGLGEVGAIPPPSKLRPEVWRLTRLRPANQPARRIAGAVDVLNRLGSMPIETLADIVLGARHPAAVRKALVARSEGGSGIGRGRADEVAVSVVLPFVSALLGTPPQPRDLYVRYPSPPATRWTRLMIGLCRSAGHLLTVQRAPMHQGFHLLYTAHCRSSRQEGCRVCEPRR